ncbi:MAG: hypothetical protein R6X12_06350 [bacterium]
MRTAVFLWLVLLTAFGIAEVSTAPRATLVEQDRVPLFLNYQGYLTDTLGSPLSGSMAMVFAIFGDSLGGTPMYSHSQFVTVTRGVFNVKLPLAAGDTTHFVSGDRRWLELTVNSHQLSPRTEITTMAFGLHALHADNADMLDGRHAAGLIWNQTALQSGSNWHISGSGVAETRLVALGGGISGSAAVEGQVSGTNNVGVLGNSPGNVGVYGTSESGTGVAGLSAGDGGFALQGFNSSPVGTGIIAAGTADSGFYTPGGSGGAFTARSIGLFAHARDTSGTAIAALGNRISGAVYTLPQGSGGSFNGALIGVHGLARDSTAGPGTMIAGGYFRAWPDNAMTQAWVAARYASTVYKIIGDGVVSSVMPTGSGRRVLFAPESPEPFFEDLGFGRLVSGHCRVELDPTFRDCIQVDDANPLKVFVTLNDDCNGVFVQPDVAGFDVRELHGGRSNARFTWRAVASRKGSAGLRLPAAPETPRDVETPVGRLVAPAAPAR